MSDPLPIREGLEIPASDLSWSFSRSGGPGGQHVNTADTRARLRFDLEGCTVLRPAVKARLREQRPGWLSSDGSLQITCDSHRSRQRNVEEARERLAEAVREALRPPKKRKATRPTRSSQKRRLQKKKERGQVKAKRGRIRED